MTYFGLALFCTGVFLVQFILSMILGNLDLDFDVDGDGNMDISTSDILSFKGLIHFGIGFSWTMWFGREQNQLMMALIAIIVGIVFVVVLFGVYYITYKLKKDIKIESGEELVGRSVEVYLPLENKKVSVWVTINGRKQLINVIGGDKEYKTGDTSTIVKYENGVYFIV